VAKFELEGLLELLGGASCLLPQLVEFRNNSLYLRPLLAGVNSAQEQLKCDNAKNPLIRLQLYLQ